MASPFLHSKPTFEFETFNELENEPTAKWRKRSFEELRTRVQRIEIIDSDTGMDELRVTLNNRDLQLMRNPEVAFGRVWGVAIGYEDLLPDWRYFRVVSVTGYQEMELRAFSLHEYDINIQERNEEWNVDRVISILKGVAAPRIRDGKAKGIRRSDVAEAIGLRQGFRGAVFDVEETRGDFEKIMQTNMTDAKLLQKMADALGFVWWVDSFREDGTRLPLPTLHFHSRDFGQDPSYEFDHDDESLLEEPEADFNVHLIPAFGFAMGIDPVEQLIYNEQVNLDTARRVVTGSATPIQDYEKAFPSTGQKANQIAEERDGIFKKWEENLLKLDLTMIGDPRVRPKTTCVLKNFPRYWNNIPWYIDSVRYTLVPGESFKMIVSLRGKAYAFESAQEASLEILRLRKVREELIVRIKEKRRIDAEKAKKRQKENEDVITLVPGKVQFVTPGGQFFRGYETKQNVRRRPPNAPYGPLVGPNQ